MSDSYPDEETANPTAVAFDPFSEDTKADPEFFYAQMRARCPVHKFTNFEYPLYSLTRYEDVYAQLRDPELWSSQYGQLPFYTEEGGLRSDPPEHTIYRRLLNPIFNARRIAPLGTMFADVVHQRIDQFIDKGEGDIFSDFAALVPIYAIAGLLGVDPEEHDIFRSWVAQFIRCANSGQAAGEAEATALIWSYFKKRMDDRRRLIAEQGVEGVPDDVVTLLVTARHPEGRSFTDDEVKMLTVLLLAGGTDTTTYLLTNVVYRLLENRELWEQVCADPTLVDVAVEESLRIDPPVLGTFRTCTRPVTIRGIDIPEKSKVQWLAMSANHDPAAWERPEQFRLDRDIATLRRNHLAFGFGIHFCVGAPLARLEGAIALRALTERVPSLRLNGSPERVLTYIMHGLESLPVAWDT